MPGRAPGARRPRSAPTARRRGRWSARHPPGRTRRTPWPPRCPARPGRQRPSPAASLPTPASLKTAAAAAARRAVPGVPPSSPPWEPVTSTSPRHRGRQRGGVQRPDARAAVAQQVPGLLRRSGRRRGGHRPGERADGLLAGHADFAAQRAGGRVDGRDRPVPQRVAAVPDAGGHVADGRGGTPRSPRSSRPLTPARSRPTPASLNTIARTPARPPAGPGSGPVRTDDRHRRRVALVQLRGAVDDDQVVGVARPAAHRPLPAGAASGSPGRSAARRP